MFCDSWLCLPARLEWSTSGSDLAPQVPRMFQPSVFRREQVYSSGDSGVERESTENGSVEGRKEGCSPYNFIETRIVFWKVFRSCRLVKSDLKFLILFPRCHNIFFLFFTLRDFWYRFRCLLFFLIFTSTTDRIVCCGKDSEMLRVSFLNVSAFTW